MKTKRLRYILLPLVLAGLGALLIFAIAEKQEDDAAYRSLFFRENRTFTPRVPDMADFAGEKAPLQYYYVRESLEREIMAATFMHSSTLLMFKRAYRWFPVIEPVLKANGIPDDFKYLAVAESNLANVVSPSGAEGFWQFLKPTGQKYGLEINEEVDERYNLSKATQAACLYFQEAYARYGNWTLVAASFNRGLDGISNAIQNQKVKNYYDLYLNDETARYVFRILAMKEVYLNPGKYGFFILEKDLYRPVPTYAVTVDTAITSLPGFAMNLKTNYRILREFNPWIRRYNLPNKTRKQYTFLLPRPGMILADSLYRDLPQGDRFFHDTTRIDQLH